MTPVRLSWERTDRYRPVGVLAGTGLTAAAALGLFGLPPVPLHSPLREFGLVCPLCGGTRAVAALMHGDFAGAWHYNPVAFVVVLGAALVLLRLAFGVITGRWLTVTVVRPRPVYTAVALLVAGLWTNQALRADRLLDQPVPGAAGRSLILATAGGLLILTLAIVLARASTRSDTARTRHGR